ncbi:MAG TPA: NAD(P)-dependent oxidoreductase [Thermoanaerobaculia bacterium]|nr:NAD(P)-dependent oxidoreductase [Thermoanaerobaculia bacterium]
MKIAFIGLGAMGYPMARHVAKNHEVVVWNRTRTVAEKHAAEHGTRLAEMLEWCTEAEVIITVLPTSREVDAIVDELLEDLQTGTLWIDATSGDPETSRATAARLSHHCVEFVDAPVTGAVVGAESGTLTVMVGSSEEGFRRAEPILQTFGKKIVHVGPVGSGHAIKAITNAMMATNLWMAAEGLVVLKKLGIEMKTAFEVINAGSGRSNASENLMPMRIVEGKWPLIFKLALHDKDIRIAAAIAHGEHVSTPMLALTSQLYTAALQNLGDQADYVEVAKFAAMLSGESWE